MAHQRGAPPPFPPRQSASSSRPSQSGQHSHEHMAPGDKPITGTNSCISIPMNFPALWYHHPDNPEIVICSRCFEQNLRGTQFENVFQCRHHDDKEPRVCHFLTPRVEHLLKEAKVSGSTQNLVDYMTFRFAIPQCKGIRGASASDGFRWFKAKDNAMPGFVICQACWEDRVVFREAFAGRFEPSPNVQPETVMWSCDLAVPYIRSQFDRRFEANDWDGFVAESMGRLNIPGCPGASKTRYNSHRWFCPDASPYLLICAACYCDTVLGTDQERKWHSSSTAVTPGSNQPVQYADEILCMLGAKASLSVAMGFAKDHKDYGIFWAAVDALLGFPLCEPNGTKGTNWFTLRQDLPGFTICEPCYVGLVKPMRLDDLFMRRPPHTVPEQGLRCCYNPGFPRVGRYMMHLMEAFYTHDASRLASFATEYAQIPQCRGRKLLQNAEWFGWDECNICPECHHEFVRGTALERYMAFRPVGLNGGTGPRRLAKSSMCELYSPRMRRLYLASCAHSPLDEEATELRVFSARRRGVYAQTVLVVEQLRRQQELALGQQILLNQEGSFYTWLGGVEAVNIGSTHTFGRADVGYGFANEHELTGAVLAKQATEVGAQVGSVSYRMRVDELERQWAEVA
ncbi:hypothetical protein B0I35DRAFT_447331 [Stachybotrys elegans]|uniref:Integral membrane protein n=1 Tax=Stachybotrys elegans TaxID=80388 RepID=A0A8K0WK59_9HYPO|nr:hypothetical protein B0I35DRAFT_447331 [Stachybotrys elegans]